MNQKLEPRCIIQENAKRVTQLHDRIHETVKRRDSSPEARAEWSRACAEFHAQYDALAFPGGYAAGLVKIQAVTVTLSRPRWPLLRFGPAFFALRISAPN